MFTLRFFIPDKFALGTLWGTHWGCIGDALGMHWGYSGDALGTNWRHIGDALGMHWGRNGVAFGQASDLALYGESSKKIKVYFLAVNRPDRPKSLEKSLPLTRCHI